MPTYQYACTTCGQQLEAVQSFSDEPLTECPACQGRLRKVFNSVGIVFKGSGFYRTDSRASGSETTAGGTATKPASPSRPPVTAPRPRRPLRCPRPRPVVLGLVVLLGSSSGGSGGGKAAAASSTS